MQSKDLQQPKQVDQRALARFRARPYALEYQEMMKGRK